MDDTLSNAPVESWDIERLVPYERNNKKHPASQVEALAASIAESGLENPILVEEDGTIISGHGRWLAVQSLGWAKVPVRVAVGIDKTQARKLRIAVNKTTGQDYDVDALMAELGDLKNLDVSLDNMGLTSTEMETLLEDIGTMDYETITTKIAEEVAAHEEAVAETAKEAEASNIPIGKAFGTKVVSNSDARIITRFMGVVEAEYGVEGWPAIVQHMKRVVDEAA